MKLFIAVIAIYLGMLLVILQVDTVQAHQKCERIAATTHQELRFVGSMFSDNGCYIARDGDWVEIETGKVIP